MPPVRPGVGGSFTWAAWPHDSPTLSEHLRSRQQTGDALRSAGVPVTEFRAGVIVGSGSLSFEMMRYLTERVPVMICPRWVYTRTQPIGIREVLEYLTAALSIPESAEQIIEIGGAEVVTYGEMMTQYAQVRGLKRWMVPVPVLTPRLSSYWVNLVTPIPAVIARPLIEGLRNENIVQDPSCPPVVPRHSAGGLSDVGRAGAHRAARQQHRDHLERRAEHQPGRGAAADADRRRRHDCRASPARRPRLTRRDLCDLHRAGRRGAAGST